MCRPLLSGRNGDVAGNPWAYHGSSGATAVALPWSWARGSSAFLTVW